MEVTGVYHRTYLDKVLTECLWTWRLGRLPVCQGQEEAFLLRSLGL